MHFCYQGPTDKPENIFIFQQVENPGFYWIFIEHFLCREHEQHAVITVIRVPSLVGDKNGEKQLSIMCAMISHTEEKGSFKLGNLHRGGKALEFSGLEKREVSQAGKKYRLKGWEEEDSRCFRNAHWFRLLESQGSPRVGLGDHQRCCVLCRGVHSVSWGH